MAERAALDQQQQQLETQPQNPQLAKEDMLVCVTALEAALLPCLPARELQAIDRSPNPSHQIDVERHARDFMEAAKKLQLYFISLQREDEPTRTETLRKEIAVMEDELKAKNDLIRKQERLIEGWKLELKGQLDKLNSELQKEIVVMKDESKVENDLIKNQERLNEGWRLKGQLDKLNSKPQKV